MFKYRWIVPVLLSIILSIYLYSGRLPSTSKSTPAGLLLRPLTKTLSTGITTNTRLFQLVPNPAIYILDYQTLHDQGETFNRIAVFLEFKDAPKDRVLDDVALATFLARHQQNPDTVFFGHDYRAADLVRFFATAQASGVELNTAETKLREVLIQLDFMRMQTGKPVMVAPEKALISVTQPQPDNPATRENEAVTSSTRRTVLSHELSHGEFFTHPAYAVYCQTFWREKLTVHQRAAFTRFLADQGYDIDNTALLINEFQAYLAYSGDDGKFFRSDVVKDLTGAEIACLRERFLAYSPALFKPLVEHQGRCTPPPLLTGRGNGN